MSIPSIVNALQIVTKIALNEIKLPRRRAINMFNFNFHFILHILVIKFEL